MQKIFGEMMHEAREKRGLTRAELAKRVGISASYCGDIERGKYTPTWFIWVKICNELEIDIKSFADKYIKPDLEETAKILGIKLTWQ